MNDYRRISKWWKKLIRYEFWPFWFFYIPAYFYAVWLVIRYGAWCYFTPTNPCMRYGGAFGTDKEKLLKQLPDKYVPTSVILKRKTDIKTAKKRIEDRKINFPLIAKPNIGERGINVEKIDNLKALEAYLQQQKYDTLIQEYINYSIELGVMYYRFPDGSRENITSATLKEFLSVTGDGKSSLQALLYTRERAQFRMKYLQKKFKDRLDEVIPKGTTLLLEPIGNHNRGTKFLNANHLINNDLINVFSCIAKEVEGYYYGRFDVKVKSIADLYKGEHMKILELNGVNSEITHIYDPEYSIVAAYKDIFMHMKIIAQIGMQNRQRGYKPTPVIPFLRDMTKHLRKK